MKILIIFIIANIVNVILQTCHSIALVKCGKLVAATVNAVAFGFYTWIIILTSADLPLLEKCLIVAGINFVCTYGVKWVEQKLRKDKLWKIEMSIPRDKRYELIASDEFQFMKGKTWTRNISDTHAQMIFYCENQKESQIVKDLAKKYGGKTFATECAPF